MRLFVALELPPDVIALVTEATAGSSERHPGVAWTAPDSWHVTLAFLGEVDGDAWPRSRRSWPSLPTARQRCRSAWPIRGGSVDASRGSAWRTTRRAP